MAVNVNEDIEASVETENTALLTGGHTDMGRRSGSCRQRLLFLARLLLHLGCLGYNLYLIWLLAYLKDNPYYWFLSFIPFFLNLGPFLEIFTHDHDSLAPSLGVVFTLMTCFTMLTRLAYYHRQPDEFIGPRFIILSLQGSIILTLLDFYLQRKGRLESLLEDKDAFTRMLLDFVDIFNMIEILSANECGGLGSFVFENSSTERSIQAFCTMSFWIIFAALLNPEDLKGQSQSNDDNSDQQRKPRTRGEQLFTLVTTFSGLYQNLPFLVIRIVVWARFKLYSLGFLVKNATVIVTFIVQYWKENKYH